MTSMTLNVMIICRYTCRKNHIVGIYTVYFYFLRSLGYVTCINHKILALFQLVKLALKNPFHYSIQDGHVYGDFYCIPAKCLLCALLDVYTLIKSRN